MSVDVWTKMALTIIAVSLAVIAFKLPFVDAGHAQTSACGTTSAAPCYIASGFDQGLRVQITNPNDFIR